MTSPHATASTLLATLVDESTSSPLPLPPGLTARYGGPIGFPETDHPYVFANFVSTIDGIVSFAVPGKTQARFVSRSHPADRFVLGFLRACADVIVVGAGTLREERGGLWTAEQAFPATAADFQELRRALGKPARAPVVFVSGSGAVDLDAPAFRAGEPVFILTGERGASRLGRVPDHVSVIASAKDRPAPAEIVGSVRRETGARLVLTEGGPTLFGEFLRAGLVDELFVTIAPLLAGRSDEARRLALVEGAAFAPESAPAGKLVSLKRSGDYLFMRLALR